MSLFDIFKKKDNNKEKLKSLEEIIAGGYSSQIYNVVPFLRDNSNEIREAAANMIIYLFRKIDNKKTYYKTLKYCDISKNNIDFYEKTFSKDTLIELLAICSFNRNGYVRQKAVEKLSLLKGPRVIQFLIYRLADWVKPVRQAALSGIENFKTNDSIDALAENLSVFEWLQKVQRVDLSGIHKDIMDFIVIENRKYILDNFKNYPDKTRIILARQMSLGAICGNSIELKLFLSDKHFLIRNLALKHFEQLNSGEIDKLLHDKSAKIRLQTLYQLKNNDNFKNIVTEFIADNSLSIRSFARFTLKSIILDFPEVYYKNLINNEFIIGSLIGLAEMNAKNYSGTVADFLNSKIVKIRKTAFLSLCKLDEDAAYKYGINNLDSEFRGIRNVIVESLPGMQRDDTLKKARELFNAGNSEIKKSILRLFNNIGGWEIVSDLMLGTIDDNEIIRQQSFDYLQLWRGQAIRLFTIPRQEDIDRAKQVFAFVSEIHNDKKYFSTNPLDELDFYFR